MRILRIVFNLLLAVGIVCEATWFFTGKEKDFLIIIGLVIHAVGVALGIIHYVIESTISR